MKVKVVILHHNKPENADLLFERLSEAFDVSLWDSGSLSNRIPKHLTRSFPNIYWTGAWNEIMQLYSDCDVIWMPGCDLTLRNQPADYRKAIESAYPFGVWSPCIEGRAHPFMLAQNYVDGLPHTVRNVEGMALACSGSLMREVRQLVKGSDIGFGQDYWLCYRARKLGLRNIIDGSVQVFHPEGIGYDEQLAHSQMEQAFTREYGPNFRQTIFEYDESFGGNLLGQFQPAAGKDRQMLTIFTIDNGWGLAEFTEIVRQLPDCKRLLMKKGVSPLLDAGKEIEVVPYNSDLSGFADGNHIGLFSRLGPANFEDYKKLLALGVPCVVNVSYHRDTIRHEFNGFVYGSTSWAVGWLKALMDPAFRDKIRQNSLSMTAPVFVPSPPPKPSLISVITPTCKRDPRIVTRCINCLQLQTVTDWEHLLCSDGYEERAVRDLVTFMGDKRVKYQYVPKSDKAGDFGNTVRNEMLKRATGKYVLFFDDDNVIQPDYLEKMVKALESSGADFAVAKIVHFGPFNEAETGKPPQVLSGFPVKLYHIDPLQVLVKREAMLSIGWDCEHGYISDGITLESLGKRYKPVEVPEVLGFHL